MKPSVDRLRTFFLNFVTDTERWWWSALALAFIVHVSLVLPVLTPNLNDIGMFDESSYVEMGRTVNNLLPVDETPLTALFYVLTYIPVRNSDFWLIYSCTIGRFVLFGLLWVSWYLVAKRTPGIATPMIVGFLLVSPVLTSLITNGNHALFTAIAAFALAQILSFYRRKKLTSLWIASVLVSLALLTRMGEGTFLLIAFITIATLLGIWSRRVGGVLAAASIPVVVIVGGYMLVYYSSTGKSPFGNGEYLYGTFEQGHALAYADQFTDHSWAEGEIAAQRLFGTSEDNQNSVITAIRRNPTAYLRRVPRLAKMALETSISAYGGPLSLWFFLLALQGCVDLISKKHFLLLFILCSWATYLLIYVLLVFQPTHFLFPFPIVFCLASIGLISVVSLPKNQRYLWSAMVVGLIALAIERNISLPFISSAVAFLAGLWIVWLFLNRYRNFEMVIPSALIFLFSMMFLFRGGVPSQKIRKLGIAPEEQALLFLRRNFAEDSRMAAYSIVPRAAKMDRVNLLGLKLKSSGKESAEQALVRWMIDNKVETIYVDDNLRRYENLWALIKGQIGKSLEIAFVSDHEDVEILRLTKTAKAEFHVTS